MNIEKEYPFSNRQIWLDLTSNLWNLFINGSIKQMYVMRGSHIVYLKDTDGNVYKQPFADNESLITLNAGDVVEVTVNDPEDEIMLLTDVTLVSHAQPESTTATTETAEGSDNTIE